MKGIVTLSVFAVVVTVAQAALKCTTQDVCEEKECCLDTLFFHSAFCEPRRPEGAPCVVDDTYGEKITGKDIYYMACPCQIGMKCVPESTRTDENGRVSHVNPKCVKE